MRKEKCTKVKIGTLLGIVCICVVLTGLRLQSCSNLINGNAGLPMNYGRIMVASQYRSISDDEISNMQLRYKFNGKDVPAQGYMDFEAGTSVTIEINGYVDGVQRLHHVEPPIVVHSGSNVINIVLSKTLDEIGEPSSVPDIVLPEISDDIDEPIVDIYIEVEEIINASGVDFVEIWNAARKCTIKLEDDVYISNTLVVGNEKDITVDLNGHTISAEQHCVVFKINAGQLTIKDTSDSKEGAVSDGHGSENGGNIVINGGTVNLEGGHIKNGSAPKGAGIYIDGGILNIRGGFIENNTGRAYNGWCYGGGIAMQGGNVNMSGGEIRNNGTAQNISYTGGGGVMIDAKNSNAIFRMSGGKICNNTTYEIMEGRGGGVYLYGRGDNQPNNIFEMTGGEIINNQANDGADVYIGNSKGDSICDFIQQGDAVVGVIVDSNVL